LNHDPQAIAKLHNQLAQFSSSNGSARISLIDVLPEASRSLRALAFTAGAQSANNHVENPLAMIRALSSSLPVDLAQQRHRLILI
jgi:DNA-directed RNA polymerase subunit F